MPKMLEPLGEKLQFKVSPDLKRRFEARCASMGMDRPAAARLAIALFVQNGFDYGSKNQPVEAGNVGGG